MITIRYPLFNTIIDIPLVFQLKNIDFHIIKLVTDQTIRKITHDSIKKYSSHLNIAFNSKNNYIFYKFNRKK